MVSELKKIILSPLSVLDILDVQCKYGVNFISDLMLK
jgi:hypothetical protein